MSTKAKICPLCNGRRVVKRGINKQEKQIFWCKDCKHRFSTSIQKKNTLTKHIWIDFVFHKQVMREIGETYDLNIKTVYSHILLYKPKEKKHTPRAIHLLVDALYFGTREDYTTWCVVVFRDNDTKENLWWKYADTETERDYREGREYLEKIGYTILSVTGDGFGGLKTAFYGILYQMCLVHMERIIIRGTTRNPILKASQVLLALIKTVFDTDEELFKIRFNKYLELYGDFINEKAISEITGKPWYVHEDLRKATLSLQRFLPYLFTFKKDKDIPPTTNSLEGHFSHLRDIVNIHRGASKELKQKMIHTILLASTIAPKDDEIKNII